MMTFFILFNANIAPDYIGALFLIATNLFLLWSFFRTHYELSQTELKCACGLLKKQLK